MASGALCCKIALQAANLNVFKYAVEVSDREYAHMAVDAAKTMLARYGFMADTIYTQAVEAK